MVFNTRTLSKKKNAIMVTVWQDGDLFSPLNTATEENKLQSLVMCTLDLPTGFTHEGSASATNQDNHEMLDITEEEDDVLFPISDQEAAKTLLPSGKSQIELCQGWLPTVINKYIVCL